jgi:hypothetical protein
MLAQRRGHLPVGPGPAEPGWGLRQSWGLEGATPSRSHYDMPQGVGRPQGVLRRVFSGILTIGQELPPSELTMTRAARASAQLVSLPAARFFQSYAHAGTGRATSPIVEGGGTFVPRQWTSSSKGVSAWGSAELHPATTYDPYPAPGSLYPKVV